MWLEAPRKCLYPDVLEAGGNPTCPRAASRCGLCQVQGTIPATGTICAHLKELLPSQTQPPQPAADGGSSRRKLRWENLLNITEIHGTVKNHQVPWPPAMGCVSREGRSEALTYRRGPGNSTRSEPPMSLLVPVLEEPGISGLGSAWGSCGDKGWWIRGVGALCKPLPSPAVHKPSHLPKGPVPALHQDIFGFQAHFSPDEASHGQDGGAGGYAVEPLLQHCPDHSQALCQLHRPGLAPLGSPPGIQAAYEATVGAEGRAASQHDGRGSSPARPVLS